MDFNASVDRERSAFESLERGLLSFQNRCQHYSQSASPPSRTTLLIVIWGLFKLRKIQNGIDKKYGKSTGYESRALVSLPYRALILG